MRQVLELARKGEGKVSPNPLVGCVVAKEGKVIATGFHEQYGGYHAERNALLNCEENTEGAELYVNLEPCCHYGKTPPCTEIIIEKKIRKVYVGCLDSNPKVAGRGVQNLREHGILVETGILGQECRALNEVFFHYMEEGMPFLAMKYAMTLDGKIACETGDSKWVTGEGARAYVHRLRNRYRGIMAGIGTVLADDPMLDCRMEGGRNPVRIVCDSKLRIPMESQIVQTSSQMETIVAWNPVEAVRWRGKQEPTSPGFPESEAEGRGPLQKTVEIKGLRDKNMEEISQWKQEGKGMPLEEKVEKLGQQGVILLEVPTWEQQAGGLQKNLSGDWKALDWPISQLALQRNQSQLYLPGLLHQLAGRGIDSILLEGGGTLNASALQEGLVQRVYAFIAPKLVAGAAAKSPVEGSGIPRMMDAVQLTDVEITRFGEDLCMAGRVARKA